MDGGRAGGGESEFLLSLLNKRQNQHETPSQQSSSASPLPSLASPFITPLPHYHSRQQQKQHNKQSVVLDPAVAAADGPNVPFLPSWPSDGRDLPSSSRPKKFSPPFHPNFMGFPQSPLPRNQLQGNHFRRSRQVDDLKILGPLGNSTTHSYSQHKQPEHEQPQKLLGLLEQKPVFPYLMQRNGSELNVNSLHDSKSRSNVGDSGSGRNMNRQFNSRSSNGGSNTSYVGDSELDHLTEQLVNSLVVGDDKNGKKQHRNSHQKDSRSDTRGKYILSQRMRTLRRQTVCRRDIDSLNAPFLLIYESLIPPEEVKAKQKQLLMLLEKLVEKEWPQAKLYLYGSCANSFGVSKSDIDVCLAMEDEDINKSEVLLKLADILQSDNFQNVQALTRARVPIVKLMDPETGISCDICVNNILAVVNTKLLRDYACIDERLRQLAFIVKHWAKSRGVNETYQGTLSSYAYVLMCIHFLQLRRPAILPCLQEMETTCSVTVADIDCTFFDQVEKLCGFGSRNKETIAQLVWAFFNYWAYYHDYANDVISVRSGSIISKHEKDWTRRIGNDRHLICIEDPFELSHDLGRVVDKFSIRILREEFERAAEVMQYDRNPCVKLFEPYVPF